MLSKKIRMKPKEARSKAALKSGLSRTSLMDGSGVHHIRTSGNRAQENRQRKKVPPGQHERRQKDIFPGKKSKKVLAPSEVQQNLLQEWLSSQHSGKKHEADVRRTSHPLVKTEPFVPSPT